MVRGQVCLGQWLTRSGILGLWGQSNPGKEMRHAQAGEVLRPRREAGFPAGTCRSCLEGLSWPSELGLWNRDTNSPPPQGTCRRLPQATPQVFPGHCLVVKGEPWVDWAPKVWEGGGLAQEHWMTLTRLTGCSADSSCDVLSALVLWLRLAASGYHAWLEKRLPRLKNQWVKWSNDLMTAELSLGALRRLRLGPGRTQPAGTSYLGEGRCGFHEWEKRAGYQGGLF